MRLFSSRLIRLVFLLVTGSGLCFGALPRELGVLESFVENRPMALRVQMARFDPHRESAAPQGMLAFESAGQVFSVTCQGRLKVDLKILAEIKQALAACDGDRKIDRLLGPSHKFAFLSSDGAPMLEVYFAGNAVLGVRIAERQYLLKPDALPSLKAYVERILTKSSEDLLNY